MNNLSPSFIVSGSGLNKPTKEQTREFSTTQPMAEQNFKNMNSNKNCQMEEWGMHLSFLESN